MERSPSRVHVSGGTMAMECSRKCWMLSVSFFVCRKSQKDLSVKSGGGRGGGTEITSDASGT